MNAGLLHAPEFTMVRAVARAKSDLQSAREDPWWLIRKGWVYTLDEHPPKGVPPVRPLPPLRYLEALTRLWQASPRGMLEKSRQMKISWLFAYLIGWDAWFHEGRLGLIQGKRREDVDAENEHRTMGRARFIRDHLPPHLKPTVIRENTYQESYSNGSTIEAIPQGGDIIRSKVPSRVFMDEAGFHEEAENAWNAALACTENIWAVTTPNGHDFLYRQADAGRPWDSWQKWPQVLPGLHSYRTSKGIQLVALHYTADPAERTVEAQARRREGYTSVRKYMRENELNFTLASGLGVYANEFAESFHVLEPKPDGSPAYIPDPSIPLYRGWDTGYNGQACGFFQLNHDGQPVWFDQVIYKAVALPRVVQEVKLRTMKWMGRGHVVPGAPEESSRTPVIIDVGEEAAKSRNSSGESDQATLSKWGIQLRTVTVSGRKGDLVETIRASLLPRSDGRPGMLIAKNSPEMNHVIAGLAGAYHYDEPKEGKAEKELPAKDGFYDHIFDGAMNALDVISPIRPGTPGDTAGEWWKDQEPGIGTLGYDDRGQWPGA